jgi:hypothetical protein
MTEVEKIVSKADRARLVFVAAIAGACFLAVAALGVAIVANVVNARQDTKLERFSACEDDPGGDLCQRIKRESDEARSIKDTCRSFWKVGYPCPRPGSKAAERHVQTVAVQPTPTSVEGGAPPAPGNPAPAQSVSDHGASPQHHGGSGAPTTAPGQAEPPPAVPTSTQGEQDESVVDTPVEGVNKPGEDLMPAGGLLPDTVDTVGDTVSKAGNGVGEVIHGANCALLASC